jgi:creatinine amidohydrolase
MKHLILSLLLFFCLASFAQVKSFKELTTEEVAALDLEKTVVVIPGGLIEEHGPYLPLYTDGYTNEALAKKVADSIYAALRYNVLVFPTIPLGVGSPESFAGIKTYPGVVYLKPSTLRAVFMDIADMLGAQGFKWIFIIFKHGDADHNQVLNQACDYFNDNYEGKMIALTALEYDTWTGPVPTLTPEQAAENGLDIHAGMNETSRMLHNNPELVKENYTSAKPLPAKTWTDFPKLTQSVNWPGYYGSPRLATREYGEMIMNKLSHNLSDLALKIISGSDPRQFKKLGDESIQRPRVSELVKEIDLRQQLWLKKNGIK